MSEPAYETLRLTVADAVATLTLHRPEKRNAYTPRMGEELVDAFERVAADADVRAVVWTGAGASFCAGVDLDVLAAARAGRATDGPPLGSERFLRSFPARLAAFPKPIVVAVNGAAVGVGVTMILGADLRIAADTASFALPFVRLGILPGLGSTHLLPRVVGEARARELVLTGRSVPAAEAAAIGLATRVVPADALAPHAHEAAARLAACDPHVMAAAREALRFGARASFDDALRYEQAASEALAQRRRRAD